jgi:hypothetical protein
MIKVTQDNILLNKIPKSFTWYCWNGTYYPCEHNKLPVKGNDRRNTGLVFQNADILRTYTGENVIIDIKRGVRSVPNPEVANIPIAKERKLIWTKLRR